MEHHSSSDVDSFVEGGLSMKDPIEVLRMKEQDILRVKQEIEALRITAELLGEEPASAGDRRVEFRKVVNMP
jgi:hypothetical protein